MLHIQWLEIMYILILMPGIFINVFKKSWKYLSNANAYLLILLLYQIIISPIIKNYDNLYVIFFIIVGSIVPIILEMICNRMTNLTRKIKKILLSDSSVFIFPILEELQYRWLIYEVGMKLNQNNMEFIIISALAFSISHIPYLGRKGGIKLIQGIILSVIFLRYDIYICIVCHLIFNMFVKIQNERRNYNGNTV